MNLLYCFFFETFIVLCCWQCVLLLIFFRVCYYVILLVFLCAFVCLVLFFFFFKQKTAYEMRISDWSSDVCSSDLRLFGACDRRLLPRNRAGPQGARPLRSDDQRRAGRDRNGARRRDRHDHGRGPRALWRQRPLSAR